MTIAFWFSDPPKTGHGRYNGSLIDAFSDALPIRYLSSALGSNDTYQRELRVNGPIKWKLPHRADVILNRTFQPEVAKLFFRSCADVSLIHYTSQHERPFSAKFPKQIATIHDLTALKSMESAIQDRAYGITVSRNIKKILKLDDIVVNSNVVKREIEEIGYNGKIHKIHLCASPTFKPANNKLEIRKRIGLPLDKHLVMSISSSSPRKNIIVIKKVMEYLGREFILVRVGSPLNTYGEFNYRGISEDLLADLYAASDVLIFPSREEGFGYPMVEAMTSGIPVVASDIQITKEILRDAGLFVESDDPCQYAELIKFAEQNSDRLSRKCINRSKEFSFQIFRKRYEDLYSSILESGE